jgi:hypothetical protein
MCISSYGVIPVANYCGEGRQFAPLTLNLTFGNCLDNTVTTEDGGSCHGGNGFRSTHSR